MGRVAKDGTHLANLVRSAAALCKAVHTSEHRRRPGRPATFLQWQIAVLIFIAIACGRKSKSSQHRFLLHHSSRLAAALAFVGLPTLPSRATYLRRYGEVYPLLQQALERGGRKAIHEHVGDARVVSVDKSLIHARGRSCRTRLLSQHPKRVDAEAGWGRSAHDGWVFGYGYEVVVCAGKDGLILPLLASVAPGNLSEHRSFGPKIAHLPSVTRYVLADAGYDDNAYGEAIEYDAKGRRTYRHFIGPMIARGNKPAVGQTRRKGKRERERQHRIARARFFAGRRGRSLYRQRQKTAEPFNDWFKERFELQDRVWHFGLANNRTTILTALLLYQSLQRYAKRLGQSSGSIAWLLDAL